MNLETCKHNLLLGFHCVTCDFDKITARLDKLENFYVNQLSHFERTLNNGFIQIKDLAIIVHKMEDRLNKLESICEKDSLRLNIWDQEVL